MKHYLPAGSHLVHPIPQQFVDNHRSAIGGEGAHASVSTRVTGDGKMKVAWPGQQNAEIRGENRVRGAAQPEVGLHRAGADGEGQLIAVLRGSNGQGRVGTDVHLPSACQMERGGRLPGGNMGTAHDARVAGRHHHSTGHARIGCRQVPHGNLRVHGNAQCHRSGKA